MMLRIFILLINNHHQLLSLTMAQMQGNIYKKIILLDNQSIFKKD